MSHLGKVTPLKGTGKLRWYKQSEWFGGVIGGTSWLAFSGLSLAWMGQTAGAVVSTFCWLLLLVIGYCLWEHRDQIKPFHAFACVLLSLSLVMPVVWFTSWDTPTDQPLASLYWVRHFRSAAACLIAPTILFCFFVQEHVYKARNDSTAA